MLVYIIYIVIYILCKVHDFCFKASNSDKLSFKALGGRSIRMVQTEIWSFAEFQQVSGVFRRSGIFCWTGFPPIFGGFELTSNESGSFLFFMKPSHSVIERKEIKGY